MVLEGQFLCCCTIVWSQGPGRLGPHSDEERVVMTLDLRDKYFVDSIVTVLAQGLRLLQIVKAGLGSSFIEHVCKIRNTKDLQVGNEHNYRRDENRNGNGTIRLLPL